MRRRQLLHLGVSGLPVALAGCTTTGDSGGGGSADSPTPTPTPEPSSSPTPSPSPTPAGTSVEVVSMGDQPDAPVEYEASMAEPLATDEHPARVRVRIRNPTDSEVVLGEERAVQFHHITSDDDALYLLPVGSRAETFAEPGCWRLTEPVAIAQYYGTISIPAGGSVSGESHVLGSADISGDVCLPRGEHRLRTRGRAAPTAADIFEGSDDATDYQWGFTLRVG